MRRLIKTVCLSAICLSCFSFSTKKNYEIKSFPENPRVFYGETGNPTKTDSRVETCEALSTEEIKLIQDCISEKTQKADHILFPDQCVPNTEHT